MDRNNKTINALFDGLVVNCKPMDNGPMDKPEIIAAMAQAAVAGGACAVRIQGVENVKAVRAAVKVPIIGYVKHYLPNSMVNITPFLEDVIALAGAGADIIAFDGTDRPRPVERLELVAAIKNQGCLALADCACLEDGQYCNLIGADIISTKLSKSTDKAHPETPNYELIERFNYSGFFVMAEGRFINNDQVYKARLSGAHCITVGTALTNLEIMTAKLLKASHLC